MQNQNYSSAILVQYECFNTSLFYNGVTHFYAIIFKNFDPSSFLFEVNPRTSKVAVNLPLDSGFKHLRFQHIWGDFWEDITVIFEIDY